MSESDLTQSLLCLNNISQIKSWSYFFLMKVFFSYVDLMIELFLFFSHFTEVFIDSILIEWLNKSFRCLTCGNDQGRKKSRFEKS